MNGVEPVRATLSVVVGFHPENVNCGGCTLCVDDAWNRGRKRCVITQEIIHYPSQIGLRCPLEFKEKEHA